MSAPELRSAHIVLEWVGVLITQAQPRGKLAEKHWFDGAAQISGGNDEVKRCHDEHQK
jgi:hypothetical protein